MPERCFRCRKITKQAAVCLRCRRVVAIQYVKVVTSYDHVIKQIIQLFKFSRAQDAAEILAHILYEAVPFLPDEVVIAYVPTAPSRVRQRGYDHAKRLAEKFAGMHNRKATTLLRRRGHARQVGSSRQVRLEQMKGVFSVVSAAAVKDQVVLLIDDIVTTGATLDAAGRALKAAGAKSVQALVVAQKQ